MTETIQTQILNILQNSKTGLQMEEVGEKLGLTRHTVAKYLEVLRAEGKIHYNKIGRTKLWTLVSAAITVRFLGMDDLDDILRIQEKILGEQNSGSSERLESLKDTTIYHLQHGDPLLNLGADIDGKLVGFIISEVRRWEFGRGGMTGWILILGVDNDYQGMGVGYKLGSTLVEHFRRKNITKIRTMVEWHEGELISYFKSLGFNMLGMLPLEKEV
ncbi:MAG TPA: GNAT family N-acetyltransferase [Acidobacteriota bacterium]|nr:GNAT family N-acetyltransferase [Acidobacteriota bacterium]